MKKIILLSLVLLLAGCNVYRETSMHIDYRPFTESSFFITESNSVSFDYTPIGYVAATSKAGNLSIWSTEYKFASPEAALKALCEEAKTLNANGIINLSFVRYYTKPGNAEEVIVSGMAIRKHSK
jgi:hypothetical protein